jgi:hypothetical protein
MNKNELVPSLHSLQCGKGQQSCRHIYKHHTLANGLLQWKFRLTTLAGTKGLWSLEWFHWNCYRVDPWRKRKKTVNYWCAQYSFCFNTLKLRNYVYAIYDIVVKQVETEDINVNVSPSLCTCNMYFQQSVVEWEPSCLIRFSYKICKDVKLLISAGIGPVSPGLFVKLLQKNIHLAQMCQKKFSWFISKIWTPTAERTQNAALLHTFQREVPQRIPDDFLYLLFCLPV